MGEGRFRFLTDDEFTALAVKEKAAYLVMAQQELLARQQILREYRKKLSEELRNKGFPTVADDHE